MAGVTREEGHLVVAAVRLLVHRDGAPPTPEQAATLLGWPPEQLRLKAAALQELGILHIVTSAYENHLEIRDHLKLEELEADSGAAIGDELADFDRRKREEAERMSRLFSDGEPEKQRRERMKDMEEGLLKFDRGKPRNPFGDDG